MRFSRIAIAGVVAGVTSVAAATALVQPYMDDRSDGLALIQSYYNALNRKEYSRAWSYYGEEKPAPDFAAFEDESSMIDMVDLVVGDIVTEGAAGSIFYQIPVAIRVTKQDSSETVMAGCFVARLANPQIQGDPFTPLHIVSDTLADAAAPVEDAVPASCE
jgi:hypothetical protein